MSLKSFCDICEKEITDRDKEFRVWHHPIRTYCQDCWMNKKNWSKIHEISILSDKRTAR